MNYLHWNQQTITDFSEKNVADMYDRGYLFTRLGKGVMQQTRSVRIDLSKFELTSENRRILKKMGDIKSETLEIPTANNDLAIPKLAKDFYDAKFGPGVMSAQKVKEMITDQEESNFNLLLAYGGDRISSIGFAICHKNPSFLHYSYPFYDLNRSPKDMGLGMMLLAIQKAKDLGKKKYVYIGSLQRPTDTYKLQFEGLEWYDGGPGGTNKWSTDIEAVKKMLSSAKI